MSEQEEQETYKDPELQALHVIVGALKQVDDETRARVLSYVNGRFGVSKAPKAKSVPSIGQGRRTA